MKLRVNWRIVFIVCALIVVGGIGSSYNHFGDSSRQNQQLKKSGQTILHDFPVTGPTLFHTSETVQPGDTMNIQGDGFNLLATAWLQLVRSDGTLDPTQKRQLSVANQSSYLVQAVVPADMPAGLWATWIQNGSTASNLLYVHQARATGYDFSEVAPGGTLRIWGRNLIPPGGDYRTAYVTFTNGNVTLTAAATAAEAFALTINTPTGLVPGTNYNVIVSNGLGGGRGETLVPAPLVIRTSGPDVWNLGVPWAADFTFSSNEYNVKTDSNLTLHAVGDGVTDDLPAIQSAADYATSHGGGVVYLPAGTYYLDNTSTSLIINTKTVLKGAGPSSTTLTYGKNAGSDTTNAFVFPNVAQVGVLDLTLQNLNNRTTRNGSTDNNGLSATPTSEAFFKNIVWQMGNQTKPILGRYDKLLIANSTFSTVSPYYAPLYINSSSNITIENNNLLYGTGRNIIHGRNVVIENNTLSVDGNLNNPNITETGGLEVSNSYNTAVRGNTIQVTGTVDHNSNDLEMILTQSAQENLTILGSAASATSTSLSDTTKDWSATTAFDANPPVSFSSAKYYTPVIALISGTGMGQWRSITAHDLHSVTTDRAWDVLPDTTTGYVITWWTADRMLIENNTIINGSEGVDLYSGSNDSAIVGNTITNSGGIGIYGLEDHGTTPTIYDSHFPAWNNLITNNTVSNTNGLVAAKIWINLIEANGVVARGNDMLSNEIRNNSLIAHNPNTVGQSQLGYENQEGYYDNIFHYLTNPDPGTIGVVGTIWEHNSAQNVSALPQLNLGSSQMTVHYAGEPTTPPCLNLSFLNRSNLATTGVQLKYLASGTSTLVARTENWPSRSDGKVTLADPNLNSLLNDSSSYDVWIKAPGFLARKVVGVTHALSTCLPMPQGLISGDFDNSNTVNLGDLVTAIRAFNYGTDAKAQLANQVFDHPVAFSDIITIIRNFRETPTGDSF